MWITLWLLVGVGVAHQMVAGEVVVAVLAALERGLDCRLLLELHIQLLWALAALETQVGQIQNLTPLPLLVEAKEELLLEQVQTVVLAAVAVLLLLAAQEIRLL